MNRTFRGAAPSNLNACVGENGNPGYQEYASGFSKAANVLIERVISDDINFPPDDFVYPICFNMRHSIELRLKWAISELQKLANIKNQQIEFDLSSSHDIGRIWQFFKATSEQIDDRYRDINTQMASTIGDIAEIDATGQVFRYPKSNDKQKHLSNVGLINIFLLKKSFKKLEKQLDTLHRMSSFFVQEYSYKTFTKNLSKADLCEIANRLPPRDEWKKESFQHIKQEILAHYNLSNRELSSAIKLIEANYDTAPMIGLSPKLHGVNKKSLIWVISLWLKLHPDARERLSTSPSVYRPSQGSVRASLFTAHGIKQEIWE